MVFEEIMINQFLQSFSTPLLDMFFQVITYFGNPLPWFVISAWLFWVGYEKKSFTLMTILLFSSLVSGVLKQIITRPRPAGLIALDDLEGYSMPSGHATLAGTLTGYTYFSNLLIKNAKWIVTILALLTAISRIYLGVHFLSDVLVGLFVGSITGWIIFKLEAKINKANFHISKIKEEALLVAFFVLIIIFDLIIPSEYYGAYAILGYFTGYAIYRHTKLKQNLTLTKTKTQLFITFVGGTTFLGILGINAYYLTTGLISQVLFFISGIFITLIWPIVISLLVEKREEQKIKKDSKKAKLKKPLLKKSRK